MYDILVPNDKDQIHSWLNIRKEQSHGFPETAPGTVALHGIANTLANHKAATGLVAAIGRNIEPYQRVIVCPPLGANTLKLLRTAQTPRTLH
jgi:hypothetical protein